jgi:hypothetical protein
MRDYPPCSAFCSSTLTDDRRRRSPLRDCSIPQRCIVPESVGILVQGSFLDDLQRLHVPSLTWGRAPEVSGRPSRALRRIAGHTLAGLLAFGGCIPTIMGIMPVEKLDLLLLGTRLLII